jgi:hypothetical protein
LRLDHVRPYLERAEWEGRFGVVAIVVSRDFQWVFGGRNRRRPGRDVWFEFDKDERRVGVIQNRHRPAPAGRRCVRPPAAQTDDGRALRIETMIDNPTDLSVARGT